jgi:hypothetical protein
LRSGWTVGGLLAVVFFAVWFVVRPKRRDGRLSTDGLLCIGFALIWWQDPLLNYSGFNVPVQWVGTHSATWPTDVQKRSYLLDGLCGQGTTSACPGEAVPIPRGNTSVRIGADGRLVVPAGTRLPRIVPLDHGVVR